MTATPGRPLLDEIERDLLDGRPVDDILRKLIILGGRAGSSELRDWASRELRGYADTDIEDLPSYRVIPALVQLDAVVAQGQVLHQTVGPHEFPVAVRDSISEHCAFRHGVGELRSLVEESGDGRTVRVAFPGQRLLAEMMTRDAAVPGQHINAIYWSVSASAVEGLLDQVRTRLAELLGELRASTPLNTAIPTAAQATHAVNVIVHGRGNRVEVVQTGVPGSQPRNGRGFWTVGRVAWSGAVGIATIAATVLGLWQAELLF